MWGHLHVPGAALSPTSEPSNTSTDPWPPRRHEGRSAQTWAEAALAPPTVGLAHPCLGLQALVLAPPGENALARGTSCRAFISWQ